MADEPENNDDAKALSQDGRIDPVDLDIAAGKPKPKARNRPPPSPELVNWAAKAEARAMKRPHPPGMILEPADFEGEVWTSPHEDIELWTLQLADCFGTRSKAVLSTFVEQLKSLCGSHWDEMTQKMRLDENELSAALAIVNAVKPKNEMEACLAAQMVATHYLAMKLAARAIRYDYDAKASSSAAKMFQAFTSQISALQALKGNRTTARQSIKVSKELHQHVHYHDDRGGMKSDGQSHATGTAESAQLTALPGEDAAGQSMPGSSGSEPVTMQDARRHKSRRA